MRAQTQALSLTTAAATTAARFIGPAASGGYRDGNFVFELVATECLGEMQILIREFADIKSEAHESYEVREGGGEILCPFMNMMQPSSFDTGTLTHHPRCR